MGDPCRPDCLGVCISPPTSSGADESWLYPEDLLPFTRRPMFLIVDASNSRVFTVLQEQQRGYPVCCVLSPQQQPPEVSS